MIIYAGDGYCRSEAIVAVYLQKKDSAKRIYATVVHSKTNSDGFKDEGILLVHTSFGFSFLLPVETKFSHFLLKMGVVARCCSDAFEVWLVL